MEQILTQTRTEGCSLISGPEEGCVRVHLDRKGAGFDWTALKMTKRRYIVLDLIACTDSSFAFRLEAYCAGGQEGEGEATNPADEGVSRKPDFDMQTGILPRVRQRVVIDLTWLEGATLFPEAAPGQLKITCHGRRVGREEIEKLQLVMMPRDEDAELIIEDAFFADEYPDIPVSEYVGEDGDPALVDELGQYTKKDWPGRTKNAEELIARLKEERSRTLDGDGLSRWGGCLEKKLAEGKGYFTSIRADGRWWLADPEGFAFISVGPDCTTIRRDCRVDGMEQFIAWLPEKDDPVFGELLTEGEGRPFRRSERRKCRMFSFEEANLIRAFGKNWHDDWSAMIERQFRAAGMNTLGNWSDPELFGKISIPYVTSLPQFPDTKKHIFRDFPDVLSEEYKQSAEECAEGLRKRKDDPWMIGYFLRNEPAWAFVDDLVVADEVLYCPERTVCKEELVKRIEKTYGTIEKLNVAWKLSLDSFEDLYESREKVSASSAEAGRFLREFSKELIREYVRVPAEACRKVDPNHMILGMRWAWISDPAIVSGWEYFDVFSINCYAFDPTKAIDNVVKLGVDLPVMIGEFHFGALDAGPISTGLKAVKTQEDRGKAIRCYIEKAAAHPAGVGCHYFQYSDQFALGRFDGENYNIGLFDICLRPYEQIMSQIKECTQHIYAVAAGELEPMEDEAKKGRVIAF